MRRYLVALVVLIGCCLPQLALAQTVSEVEICADGAAPIASEKLMFDGIEAGVGTISIGFDDIDARPVLNILLNQNGALTLGKVSSANVGKRVDLSIGDEVILSPVIVEPIWGGNVQISGDHTIEQLEEIIARITPKCAQSSGLQKER